MTNGLANATVIIILQYISIQSTVYILNLRNVTCQLYLKLRKKNEKTENKKTMSFLTQKEFPGKSSRCGGGRKQGWRKGQPGEMTTLLKIQRPGIGVSKRCNYSLS